MGVAAIPPPKGVVVRQTENETRHLYLVDYKFRRKKRFKHEKWKQRYKWHWDAQMVVCENEFDIDRLISDHVANSSKDKSEREVEIMRTRQIKKQPHAYKGEKTS